MPDRTQDIKNLRAVAVASKNYIDKSIENLKWELGTYDLGVDTINGTTSLLPSPSGTFQATMVRIDGASEVMVNDFDSNLTSISDDTGVTHSKVGNSYVIVNSSSSSSRIVLNTNLNGKHTFVFDSDTAIPYGFRINSLSLQNNIVVGKNIFEDIAFTGNNPISIYVPANSTVTISNILSSTNYYDNIHNLELSGLKVEGANKANNPTITNNASSNYTIVIAINNLSLKANQTYTISFTSNNTLASNTRFYIQQTNVAYIDTTAVSTKTNYSITFTPSADGDSLNIRVNNITAGNTGTITNVMLNEGSTVLPYEPYVSQTLPIDLTSIEDSGGNKLFADGSIKGNENLQDIITPTYQESAWDLKVVDNDTEITKSHDDTGNGIGARVFVDSNVKVLTSNVISNLDNLGYSKVGFGSFVNGSIGYAVHNTTAINIIYVRLGASYDTAEKVKTFLVNNGIEFAYERATYLTSNTDLSQLVKFEAHSNGSITLVNNNNQDTTSTFKYLKEVAK